ncbi:MAG: hypothetical protein ABI622_01680 [Chloroflexota bacterium]
MLDLFGWDVGMSTLAAVLLVGGAAVIGLSSYLIGDVAVGYEGLITGVAALFGGYIASEALGRISTWGPSFEGLYVLPAVIGAVIIGGVVDAMFRYATDGSYVHTAHPA